jgi:peptidoglycan/LPS O-acetylase OafA/YrhL
MALLVNAILNPMRPGREIPFPGWKVLGAHLLYIQELLHYREINGVFWTLCYEVQFYLVLTIMTGIAQRLPTRQAAPPGGVAPWPRFIVFAPVALLSLVVGAGWMTAPNGLFINYWYSFFLGVLVWFAIEGSVSVGYLYVYIALIVAFDVSAMLWSQNAGLDYAWSAAIIITALSIYACSRLGKMGTWLSAGPIQFLGRISYSLYLVHVPVSATLNSLGVRLIGHSRLLIIPWLIASTFASIAVAYLMFRFVERPGMRLAQRFKSPTAARRTVLAPVAA